jgi:Na+-transporting NADH:ubiquinone oxidoreductase subunit F
MTTMTSNETDYRLTGPRARYATDHGLADAAWFQPVIDPATLRSLQVRSNARAAIDTLLWFAALAGAGLLAWWSLGTWWAIPAFALYGALYGGAADARWHECGHGTAFRTRCLNDVVYHLACFMLWRGPTVWRWSHHRHHTDTIIVGRDAEIVFQRPPNVARSVFAFTHLQGGPLMLWRLCRHAAGTIDDEARDFVPESELRRVVWESRIFVGITAAIVVWSVAIWSIVPLLFIGLPTIYGAWLMVFFGITQHAGLREDVLDHRLNTRTVKMNPVFRFLYLNMNYHVEHHLVPSVPYRALPRLHDEIRDQLAPALPNTWAAYRQIFTTLSRQAHDPTYEIPIELPDVPGATPERIHVGEENWYRHSGVADLGALVAVPVGSLTRVDAGGHTYVLCRVSETEVTLADGLCTHAAVHLCDGALIDGQIECPKHNARFDARTGEVVRKPARSSLATYDVEINGGRLITRFQQNSRSASSPGDPCAGAEPASTQSPDEPTTEELTMKNEVS